MKTAQMWRPDWPRRPLLRPRQKEDAGDHDGKLAAFITPGRALVRLVNASDQRMRKLCFIVVRRAKSQL